MARRNEERRFNRRDHEEDRDRSWRGRGGPHEGYDWQAWERGDWREGDRRPNWTSEVHDRFRFYEEREPHYGLGRDFSDDYGRSYNRGSYQDYENESDLAWDRGRDENYDYNRGFGRGYGPSGENRREPLRRRQVPTAGMRSDFRDEPGYQENQGFGEDYQQHGSHRPDRGGRRMGSGYGDYIGYEREGAFYQDLDEPYSRQYWEGGREIPNFENPGRSSRRGPGGYRRSDDRIMEDVCERLTNHGWVDASQMEVFVENGLVTLRGTAPDRQTKRLAENLAESISGVDDVLNELRLRARSQQRGGESPFGASGEAQAQSISPEGVRSGPSVQTNREDSARDFHSKVREGMEVLGKNGKVIGLVKEIRGSDFLVDRELARDVYVPFDAVESIGTQAMLKIESTEVDDQDWEKPSLF